MSLTWTADLDTGIAVIDDQHRRLVDYVNQLETVHSKGDLPTVGHVLDDLVDYTLSHFAFEETLLEESGYAYLKAHKRVHQLFTRRVEEYRERFKRGEDVSAEIHRLLSSWLLNHIKHDDADYVATVSPQIKDTLDEQKNAGWLARTLGRFF
ncbi:bacteriohemerythrin [Azoarcus sp. TTM-91]|uniref:bacteriohemerythrin n=1 Tax=Azoarcus sp. TTM-91 TaxID=2691581 RepID=UPI00145E5B8B|nr:bacteriohemerythrin [Azoarcus sp. TTM-91]